MNIENYFVMFVLLYQVIQTNGNILLRIILCQNANIWANVLKRKDVEDMKGDRYVNYGRIMDVDTVTLSDCENLYNNGDIVVEINDGYIVRFLYERK